MSCSDQDSKTILKAINSVKIRTARKLPVLYKRIKIKKQTERDLAIKEGRF